nr:MAG TPA: ISOLEUCYL-TRNA SYNTHETASE [Caudoviricetes sp.]
MIKSSKRARCARCWRRSRRAETSAGCWSAGGS